MAKLERLIKVPLREFWEGEASDFTPWLAEEENISLLGETIRVELEVEAQERNVGPFRADILCKDTATDDWVLIKNQLERTDHTYLGQLLTYAAGLEAVTVVWIAERFTDEHRAALDWLNEITAEGVSFFGLEIELWRIGDSPRAPKFNVVSHPNDWTKTVFAESTERLDSHAAIISRILDRATRPSRTTRWGNQACETFTAELDGVWYWSFKIPGLMFPLASETNGSVLVSRLEDQMQNLTSTS